MVGSTLRNVSDHPRRVLLVDDHPVVRLGLTQLINQETDLVVCGKATEAMAAREAVMGER